MGGPPMRTSRTPRWSFLLAVLASQIHTPTLASSSSRAFPCGPIPPTRATRSSCRRSSNRRPRATSSMRRSGSGRRRSFRVRKAGDHGGLPGRADPRGQLLPDREELLHAPGLAYDGLGIYAWDATAPAMLFMRTFALWWALDGTLQSYVPGPDLAIDVIRGDVENVLQLAGYFDLAFFGPAVCLAGKSRGGAVAEPDDPAGPRLLLPRPLHRRPRPPGFVRPHLGRIPTDRLERRLPLRRLAPRRGQFSSYSLPALTYPVRPAAGPLDTAWPSWGEVPGEQVPARPDPRIDQLRQGAGEAGHRSDQHARVPETAAHPPARRAVPDVSRRGAHAIHALPRRRLHGEADLRFAPGRLADS